MHRKILNFWIKHEGWAAPVAMVFFLIAGLQIGSRIGSSETQLLNAQTIKDMQVSLDAKDELIADKDKRLRTLNDRSMAKQDEATVTTSKAANAAVDAAKAAQIAAEAAKTTVDNVTRGLTEFPPKVNPQP